MIFKDHHEVNELATKQMNKFCVYVSNGLEMNSKEDEAVWLFVLDEVRKICNNVEGQEFYNFMSGLVCSGCFFFDIEEKAKEFYSIFEKELTDSSAIYANLISPINGIITENT